MWLIDDVRLGFYKGGVSPNGRSLGISISNSVFLCKAKNGGDSDTAHWPAREGVGMGGGNDNTLRVI